MEVKEFRGALRVSNDAVSEIAAAAAGEVDGVVCGKKNIAVRYNGGAAEINVSMRLKKGAKAALCAETVQHKVRDNIQCMTGITVSRVDIDIYSLA